ncbi:MAG: DUF1697 domain-containing protein [Calditrichaeota bacterium]|nr:DUF1697 domain-containing protein [Calditrichota bacterium]MCB0290274.1 DUF1697 domain-containing protein [Calditrichota bacterium]MCB0294505.1 DUF1697 domain-containing protein [Calditrichota bacterium]MCB0305659.1 DUF1697 domain-containing protein [Calditrichota bacterium]
MREKIIALNYENIKTYIQNGNVVFPIRKEVDNQAACNRALFDRFFLTCNWHYKQTGKS